MEEYITDDTRKLIEILKTLSSFPLDGIPLIDRLGFNVSDNDATSLNYSDGMNAIRIFASEQENVVESIRRILNQTNNLQIQLFNYLFIVLEDKKKSQVQEIKQMEDDIKNKMESSKQMTFTPPEILKLTKRFNVKGKMSINTIISHLNNGTLKGQKQKNGTWIVKREDLVNYLGRDDF